MACALKPPLGRQAPCRAAAAGRPGCRGRSERGIGAFSRVIAERGLCATEERFWEPTISAPRELHVVPPPPNKQISGTHAKTYSPSSSGMRAPPPLLLRARTTPAPPPSATRTSRARPWRWLSAAGCGTPTRPSPPACALRAPGRPEGLATGGRQIRAGSTTPHASGMTIGPPRQAQRAPPPPARPGTKPTHAAPAPRRWMLCPLPMSTFRKKLGPSGPGSSATFITCGEHTRGHHHPQPRQPRGGGREGRGARGGAQPPRGARLPRGQLGVEVGVGHPVHLRVPVEAVELPERRCGAGRGGRAFF